MRTVQVVSNQPIIADCSVLYNCMAFDGKYLYFLDPTSGKIYIYNLSLEYLSCKQPCKKYKYICYDCNEKCFWAYSSYSYKKIYKLDECFNEIDYIYINKTNSMCDTVIGISNNYCNETLLISYRDEIIEVDKKTGSKIKIILPKSSYEYGPITYSCGDYAYLCEKGSLQSVCFSKTDEKNIIKCFLDEKYIIKDIESVIYEKDFCTFKYIQVLALKNFKYHYIIKLKIIDPYELSSYIEPFEDEIKETQQQKAHSNCGCKNYISCVKNNKDDCEKNLSNVVGSIALIEASLANILNAESEKIQNTLCKTEDVSDILKVNESVSKTIKNISHLEHMLYSKLELAKELYPKKEKEKKKKKFMMIDRYSK